ncbi:SigB/SigF/SigG family RNA polymerase sigma factor [Streptomyces sp. Je 1-4]|uniref:SigB/SigF/SigG family RNA polymerase sigma factor n=1 Tax=Streptomyces TaxID=1883 RepID=UPI0021DA4401|nr:MULTISPECIES: SigB/SigF/SigG family RNA polymerase sigma factor [unclassified Streptomyces]UYB37851.1 SigB/SigF/SigG family RNA polymerase sigma factor [Streptomyces sp. Je 1-4]UZQ33773.1 SigB/SigF/SigG family RNA polymerase sigma factor [Streptomyces sp. Je 1-4] [Streptomyces sp. Je 1-4 4N24]UZQ41191.1 SigB/SigF/SigG family RNA polymerase sigma factor [Streptomyces sp. Je 1-4] [Streptomyces sp. Je 1-4 4N24_ara]
MATAAQQIHTSVTRSEREAAPDSARPSLPLVDKAQRVAPPDARRLSKLYFERLAALEEGTAEYQYARNTLIEMNLSLVRYVARRFRSRGQEMEDVVQVGTIGLIKAIDRFDVSRENEFTTFSIPYITGEIKRFFRDTTWSVHVPRRLQELRVDLARAREELEGRGIPEPSVADYAALLELEEDEVIEGLVACNGYDAASIDRPIEAGGGNQRTGLIADLIGNEDPALALAENLQALKPHLAQLDERERTLLELRFGAEMTQSEIGEELGLSQMHVSRLLTRICTHLREEMLATD